MLMTKQLYEVKKVIDVNGLRFPGELVELTEEEAKGLPVKPFGKSPVVETADLNLEKIETADAKPVRKGRDNAHTSRNKPK